MKFVGQVEEAAHHATDLEYQPNLTLTLINHAAWRREKYTKYTVYGLDLTRLPNQHSCCPWWSEGWLFSYYKKVHAHTHTLHIYIYFPFSLYLYIYIMYTYAAGAMEPWILRFGLPATDTLANCYVKVVILEVLRIYICFVDFQECLRGVPVQNPFCPFHAVNTLSLNLPWAMGFSGWFLAPGPHLLFYLRDAWHAVRGWRLHRGIWFC